ncbi:Uncharacterised protein [BD1-7 clade bacterium]|uniref:Uncharacterized protein n=1 Tax=BD1-7 clade bacterium TaxID=2029982 RepID=A0A5S9P4U3_9GAMM|nr:Uncharacterised protein [BD1-7 clade bacterium]CAA0098449.1 Uncharacterised protein [BD1-7 clade bacterium]
MHYLKKMAYPLALSAMIASPTMLANPIIIGAVGDSMTDEYLDTGTNANTDIAAYNWVEILAGLRGQHLNFGEYRPTLKNGWPDHRAAGYQYNFAKVAATASPAARVSLDLWITTYDMPIDSAAMESTYVDDQVTGLLNEPVEFVVVAAGSNDYFFKSNDISLFGNPSRNDEAVDQKFADDVVSSLIRHVDRLQEKDMKVLLAYIPMGTAGGADKAILDSIVYANKTLETAALKRGIPMVKMFDFAKNKDGGITVGDVTVALKGVAKSADLVPKGTQGAGKCRSDGLCAGPTHKSHFIADDELHPNTLVQAQMANQILNALNQGYQLNVPLLTEEEMLSLTNRSAL